MNELTTSSGQVAQRTDLRPVLDIVVPVFNEERDLAPCVERLRAYLDGAMPYRTVITIADNASTDGTLRVALDLQVRVADVRVLHLDAKGRGRALAAAWGQSDADVLVYMDVDLSTDLNALLPLVAPLVSGHSDLSIGSRLSRGSRVVRGPKREVISRCYNLLLRTTLAAHFSDAQCGFKAIRADRAQELLPYVVDTGWFFDTELLVLAQRAGLRIHEVPVDWVDDPDSRVDIVATAVGDIKGIARLGRAIVRGELPVAQLREPAAVEAHLPTPPGLVGQMGRFAAVGLASTAAYAVLYLLLRGMMPAQGANALALFLTTVANTAANRRVTFGVRGRRDRLRHQAQGIAVFALGLAVTSGSLLLLSASTANASHGLELAVLVAANVVATILRFLLLRAWVFPTRRATTSPLEGSVR